jgi:phage FluMu protein Com
MVGNFINRGSRKWLNGISKKRKVIVPGENKDEKKLNKPEFEYAIPFFPIKCPRCKTKDTQCYKSDPPIRYHKCDVCGFNFKSIEQI